MNQVNRRLSYPVGTSANLAERPARKPRIVIPYDITSSSPMEIVGAIGELCEIIWVVQFDDPSLGLVARFFPRFGRAVDSSGLSPDDVIELLGHDQVDGVIAFTDSQLRLASKIGDAFNLCHNPSEVVERLTDKFVQRNALESAGIEVPRYCKIPRTGEAANLAHLVEGLNFPLVLKPLVGNSSRDVQLVADLRTLTSLFEKSSSEDGPSGDDFIVEEYLIGRVHPGMEALGDYVSVESIVQDGDATPVTITGKFPLVEPFRESGNFMPHHLDVDQAAEVLDLSIEAARALGVRSGALHTEIKITPKGLRVIEVNGRIGGGGIDTIFKKTHGYSLTQLATRVALGERLDLSSGPLVEWTGPFTYEYFVQPPKSALVLRSIVGTNELVGLEGIDSVQLNKVRGDDIRWEQGNQGYLAQVGGSAENLSTLQSIPDLVRKLLEVTFDS